MNEARELYTLTEGRAILKEYVMLATNRHLFEVKNEDQILYQGESFSQAKSLYQELCQG